MAANLPSVTKTNFDQEVLKSPTPVLVDFGATWCPPCRALEPILEDLAKEYDGKIKIVQVNVDNEQDLANTYKILSLPTVLLFKAGQQVDSTVGLRSKKDLKRRLDSVLQG